MAIDDHRFHLGQTVRIAEGFGYTRVQNATYKIVALLPSNGSHYQYKVRNSGEMFDRTVRENELTVIRVQ